MKKFGAIFLLAVLVSATGCKKDTNNTTVDLMQGAVEFTGNYPDIVAVSFTTNGSPVHVNAFDGQYIVFFKQGTSETDAAQLVSTKGGSILGKIPQIGYYLIQNTSATAGTFISEIQASTLVELISPHVVCYPKAGALVLDHCNLDHGIEVQATLTSCHGTVNQCKSITTVKNNILYGSDAAIIHGIINEGNKNKTGPTYINLSFNGGLDRNTDYDFNNLSQTERDDYISSLYWYMTNVLMSVAALPDAYRANLVITIAAGNENCPINILMQTLRQRPRIADVLRDNVLIVSTEKIPGIHANYAYDDPDVVVLNNNSAYKGSSLAAPCALGYIQDAVARTGASAREVLQAVKNASWILPNREVTLENVMKMFGGEHFKGGAYILVDTLTLQSTLFKQTDNISSIDLVWYPSSGQINGVNYGFAYLTIKANVAQDCLTNCIPPTHADVNVVMLQDSAEYMDNTIGGTATAAMGTSYTFLRLQGTRSGNTINGYVVLPYSNGTGNRVNVVLQKQ